MTQATHSRLHRRAVLKAGAALALTGFPAIVRAASDQELVMNIPGGIYEQNFRPHVVEPFEKKTGRKIILRYTGAAEVLTSMIANPDHPEYDIAFLGYPMAMKAITIDGLFIDLPVGLVPNAADLDPMFYDLYDRRAAGFNYAPLGLGYDRRSVKPAPTSWQDLWRPDLKRRVMLCDLSGGWAFEQIVIAAMLNGGDLKNLEPGYDALKRLKPNVFRYYKSSPESAQLFERGEAWLGVLASSRIYAMRDQGVPVDWVAPKEGSPVGVLSFHVAKNSPNRDLAVEFTNFALGKEPQEGFANGIEFGPCSKKAVLTGKAAERVPPHEKLMRLDWRLIAPQMSTMAERWQREITT